MRIMKKLLILILIIFVPRVNAMQPAVNPVGTEPEDPAIARAHRIIAFESKEAPFHVKNSFLEAYMNPASFTAITEDTLTFAHYKYKEVAYVLPWAVALAHLREAKEKAQRVNEESEPTEFVPIKIDPFVQLSEQQTYALQIVFFKGYLANNDLKKSIASERLKQLLANRDVYKKAFDKKNGKQVIDAAKNSLHTQPFESLTLRINSFRTVALIQNCLQGGMASTRP